MPNSTRERPFDYLLMLRVEASLGRSQEAIEELDALCVDPKLKIPDRTLACRILSQLGRTRDANRHLEKLASRAKSFDDRLAVANGASAQHNWALARRVLLASKAMPQSLSEQCQFASALAAAGLKTRAMAILNELDSQTHEFLWEGGFDLLLDFGQYPRAVTICRNYQESAELNVDDRIEALGKLGDAGDRTMARQLLVRLVRDECRGALDQATGATILHRLGFETEARSILFDLAGQRDLSPHSMLWMADAMRECDLPSTAAATLVSIDETALDDDEKDCLAQMKEEIRLATFERGSRAP